MAEELKNEYTPDHAAHPGKTLREVLAALQMTQADLARRMGRSTKHVNELVQGETDFTGKTAQCLETAIGVPAGFWLRLQAHYREAQDRRELVKELGGHRGWLKRFRYREMAKLGWVPDVKGEPDRILQLLRFFGVASPIAWTQVYQRVDVRFRCANDVHREHLLAWLRRGELVAQDIQCANYSRQEFTKALTEARRLTNVSRLEVLEEALRDICARAGVAVALIPGLPGTKVFGAARWLTPTKAFIQLSNRYRRNDLLWFTFFHEAAHVINHRPRMTYVDCEDELSASDDSEEGKANRFAEDWLIPPDEYQDFIARGKFSEVDVRRFANRADIAPGVVVGRLRHEGHIRHNSLAHLLIHYDEP